MPAPPEDAVLALCSAAARGRSLQVETVVAMHPRIVATSVHAAAALVDREALARHVLADRSLASSAGPRGLTPLELVCTSRHTDDEAAAAAAVQLLLRHGADPNDGRALFAALEGERLALLDALLEAGGDATTTANPRGRSVLHFALDVCWRPSAVERLLERGADPNARAGPLEESALHVAVRRRRLDAVELLLAHGADVDARTRGGDTAWRHATRRPFPEIAKRLAERGADTTPQPADELALALLARDLDAAAAVVRAHPDVVRDLVPEEARLLADLAGQGNAESVRFLVDHGAGLEARGLDGGTPLAQCGWFGTPEVARLLIERGADVHARGCDHDSTPLGWAAHGSRYSGGAESRQDAYVALIDLLLDAGATLAHPLDPPGAPGKWILAAASERVAARLRERAQPSR